MEILYQTIIKDTSSIYYCAECGKEIKLDQDRYGNYHIDTDGNEQYFCGPICFSNYHDQHLDETLSNIDYA